MSLKNFLLSLMICFSVQNVYAQTLFTFEGQWDARESQMKVIFDFGSNDLISLNAQKIAENDYHFYLFIDHLKTPFFDLSSEVESLIKIIASDNDQERAIKPWNRNTALALSGRIWSKYSIIDYKPIRELSGHFEIKDRKLYLNTVSLGNVICDGSLELKYPYSTDLNFSLNSVNMDDFLAFWMRDKKYESAGLIYGDIKVSGSLSQLALKGNLESYDGYVQRLNFDRIRLNIEGIYPQMQIAQSTVAQSDGMSFSFYGPINLNDHKNFKKQIKALHIAPLVSYSNEKVEWTIKQRNINENRMTELKMFKRKGNEWGSDVNEVSNMIGIEKKVGF